MQSRKKRVLLVGTSHAEVLVRTHTALGSACPFQLRPIILNESRYFPWGEWCGDDYIVNPIVTADLTKALKGGTFDHVTMMIGGVSHFELGGVNSPRLFDFVIPERTDLPIVSGAEIIPYDLVRQFFRREEVNILKPLFLAKELAVSLSYMLPPPPVSDAEMIFGHLPDDWVEDARRLGVPDPIFRYKTWLAYASVVGDICAERDIPVLSPPSLTLDRDGFLKQEFSEDTLHGNGTYGEAVLEQIASFINADAVEAA